jgi:hypothetical protein
VPEETWLPIEGYEGYEVSDTGRVRSVDRIVRGSDGTPLRKARGRVLRPSQNKDGYLVVNLCDRGSQTTMAVHRLVAEAFLGVPDGMEVHHVNGIPYDDRLCNLRVVTHQENVDLKMEMGNVRHWDGYVPEPNDVADLPGEEWRPVRGYEGLYAVSSRGRVKSLGRVVRVGGGTRTQAERILAQSRNENGYLSVSLYRGGVGRRRMTHRLVAEAFLDPDPDRPFVDHVNAVRDDNRACNLRWVTQSENCRHAVEMGHVDLERLARVGNEARMRKGLEWCSKPVVRDDGKTYASAAEAARDIGVHRQSVSRVARGTCPSIHGHGFRYV